MKVLVKSLSVSLLMLASSTQAKSQLTVDVYNADSNSFTVNSSIVYGDKQAIVVDSGFTNADALRIAAKVYDSGKELTTIFISQADPDYYFGAQLLQQLFPNAKLITPEAVAQVIAKNRLNKIAFWGPKMGSNAPANPIVPTSYSLQTLQLEGHEIQIRMQAGVLAHRPYLWIPANKTILGNVAVSAGHHVWMADTQSQQSIDAWLKQLNEMKALEPAMVIPGHMEAGSALDASAIDFTFNYITAFVKAKQHSHNSQELIAKMVTLYPEFTDTSNLELGAKVHMGEMIW